MTDTFCYAGFSWRVFHNNRFVGYVVAMSGTDAYRKAQDKYTGLSSRRSEFDPPWGYCFC
jgi:hypothetical protein